MTDWRFPRTQIEMVDADDGAAAQFGKLIGDDLIWQLREFCAGFERGKCYLRVTRWALDRLNEAFSTGGWILPPPLGPGERPGMSFDGFRIEVRDD